MVHYKDISFKSIAVNNVSFGYRKIGEGQDLVFIHGFPTHGYTWRKLLPYLSKYFTCHILDMPGLGNSSWTRKSNLNIDIQAENVCQLLDILKVDQLNLIAHNSGGTIARIVAINQPSRIKNLILINTEIPNHRPPFIELYQKVSRFPFSSKYFQIKLKQQRFIRSSMGFKYTYSDKSMFDNEDNLGPYLNPLTNSYKKIKGALKFLRGIDWKLIDGFEKTHSKIQANVLLIWGEDDKTFPIKLGQEMVNQFKTHAKFKIIENASLLPHEEKPILVSQEVLNFLQPPSYVTNN